MSAQIEIIPCPVCKIDCLEMSPAEAFLHRCSHSGDEALRPPSGGLSLAQLPFVFHPVVAKAMELYRQGIEPTYKELSGSKAPQNV